MRLFPTGIPPRIIVRWFKKTARPREASHKPGSAPGANQALDRAAAALPALDAFLYGEGTVEQTQTLDELLALADNL